MEKRKYSSSAEVWNKEFWSAVFMLLAGPQISAAAEKSDTDSRIDTLLSQNDFG